MKISDLKQIIKEEKELELLSEQQKLIKERKDFHSLVLEIYIKSQAGEDFDIHTIDEGLWDKAKGQLAKLGNFSRLLPGAKMKNVRSVDDLEAAFEKAGSGLAQRALRSLEKQGFPNVEGEDAFQKLLDQVAAVAISIAGSMKAGNMPYEAGRSALELIQKFVQHNLDNKLASVYKTFKEEEEVDDEILKEEDLNEANVERVLRLVQQGKRSMEWGLKKLERFPNLRSRVKDAAEAALQSGAAGGGGGTLPVPRHIPGGVPGPIPVPPPIKLDPLTVTTPPDPGFERITSTITTYPTLKSLLATLGISPGMAAAGVGLVIGAAWLAKRRWHSRAASMRSFLKNFTIPDEAAVKAPDAEDVLRGDVEAPAEDPGGPATPGEEPAAPGEPAAGRGDVYVFRNPKDGQGMQSKFTKAGIRGKDQSRLMKGLRADLSAVGFNVLEEAKREVISLEQTLAAIEQIADPAQKEVAKKAVVDMLRQHKIKLDPQSSKALMGAPAAGAAPADAAAPAAPAAGAAPAAAAAGAAPEEKECNPGYTRDKAGKCVRDLTDFGAEEEEKGGASWASLPAQGGQSYTETLRRWHKLAGIIKG